MKTIKIEVVELEEKLQENRAKHVSDFKEATENYRKKRLKLIRKLAKEAEKDPEASILKIQRLPKPISHEGDYDRVIEQLNMEVNDTVELDATEGGEFDQLVRDQWRWQQGFTETVGLYR